MFVPEKSGIYVGVEMTCERKGFIKGFEHPDNTIPHEPHYSETHQPMFARECVRGHQCSERTLGNIVEHGAGSLKERK